MSPVLEIDGLVKSFVKKRNILGMPSEHTHAVKDVSFTLEKGRTRAIVGESGAGKSTIGRMALRLATPDTGSVKLFGEDIMKMSAKDVRKLRRRATMIFQDPFSSLDPRMLIGQSVAEPLTLHTELRGKARKQKVEELLDRVGLRVDQLDKYPHEFSGGQLQRIAIARALATEPELIVCDEPVAALDVSIQAQVLNLLQDLQRERGISYLFISHDLALVKMFAHDVTVMRRGEVVESGSTEQIFNDPQDPYTKELLSAIPVMNPRKRTARRLVASL
ncbi:UNVERIFIED_ORG: oligopeptide transport system ATP-binding protein [Nocardia globerula]|uniref:Oligopeptide transport system ATP-binding protein n=1 Tax=Nocardia globerula TaxID=1818 RepID=A0A652YT99_NOCGL|nr:ATP-binding cassette domain-containing protein [Rhodococcus globerulus]NMD61343.1 ABC transporter ATP-binding protein [Nocardia globerula]PVX67105.1 oligopeptide transport system ATP-binding protein [Rhodococcus globerulus]